MSRVLSQLPKQRMLRDGKPQQNFLIFVVFGHKFVCGFLLLTSKFSVMPHVSALCWVGLVFSIFQRKTPPAINSAEENNPQIKSHIFLVLNAFLFQQGKKQPKLILSCFYL